MIPPLLAKTIFGQTVFLASYLASGGAKNQHVCFAGYLKYTIMARVIPVMSTELTQFMECTIPYL